MLRWYDWIAAIVVADITQGFFFAGMSATTWWEPWLYGGLAGLTIKLWREQYCQYRLTKERNYER